MLTATNAAPTRLKEECLQCLEVRFCRPVRFCAGSLDVHTVPHCLTCRLNWRDSRWAVLESTHVHHTRHVCPADGCYSLAQRFTGRDAAGLRTFRCADCGTAWDITSRYREAT
jgi:hypothetical protein